MTSMMIGSSIFNLLTAFFSPQHILAGSLLCFSLVSLMLIFSTVSFLTLVHHVALADVKYWIFYF